MPSRRDFVIQMPLALLGAATASSLLHAQSRPLLNSRAAPVAPGAFAPLHFLTFDPNYSDYRPAIDAMARQVVFERTPAGGGITALSILSLSNAVPRPFIQDSQSDEIITGPTQTRPDWSWVTGEVVLNVTPDQGDIRVLIAQADGTPVRNVTDSESYIYPTWSPDGTQLIVYNSKVTAQPQPCTTLIALDGTVIVPNLDGNDADGAAVFGGFATPTPGNVNLIAYAGQPDIGWGPAANGGYNQDFNYVFLNAESDLGVYTSAPLEPGASISIFDASHQGRAPVWSPDGNYVAFESDRAGGYAIFLANVAAGTAPVQVTDASYGAQHAKFYPDGTKLVLTALQVPNSSGPRGIAWVDIEGYL